MLLKASMSLITTVTYVCMNACMYVGLEGGKVGEIQLKY